MKMKEKEKHSKALYILYIYVSMSISDYIIQLPESPLFSVYKRVYIGRYFTLPWILPS